MPHRTRIVTPACLASLFLLLTVVDAEAQHSNDSTRSREDWETEWRILPSGQTLQGPYAGKIEAHIGGSRESANDKLRLDIGGAVDLLGLVQSGRQEGNDAGHIPTLALGAEFFTWTRLRANDNFKFPVEAVDYYFGLYSNGRVPFEPSFGYRLRVAHISAHLVDGDPGFTDTAQQYITYSREFVDLMLLRDIAESSSTAARSLRPYIGALWLFHTIPDTLGVLTPYAGCDLAWQPSRSLPLTLKAGYEVRLNTELEPIGEHSMRLGVKFGTPYSRGIVIEGSYYAGRSPYGQHFHRREEYFSLGFAVDY